MTTNRSREVELFHICVALLLLLCCLSLHYMQHFRCRICTNGNDRAPFPLMIPANSSGYSQHDAIISAMMQSLKMKTRVCRNNCCILTSVDGTKFGFFPTSFLFYIIFMILLCCLILIKIIINPFQTDIILFSITSIKPNSNTNTNNIYITMIDYMLIYGIMILSIWESFHAFYSFYTTYFTTVNGLYYVSKKKVITTFFLFYGIIFIIVYIIEIHLFYWLFPIVVLLHITFNFYCCLKFASLLISSYKTFVEHGTLTVIHDELRNVYFMKKISIICCILQSIYLCLFVISYNINTIYYLPILWAISSCIFTLNFVRNRQFIKLSLHRIKIAIRSKFKAHSITVPTNSGQTDSKSSVNPITSINTLNIHQKPKVNITNTNTNTNHLNVSTNTAKSAITKPTISALSINIKAAKTCTVSKAGKSKGNNKALHLLGLTPKASDLRTKKKKKVIQPQHSIHLSLSSFGSFQRNNIPKRSNNLHITTSTPNTMTATTESVSDGNNLNKLAIPFYDHKLRLNGQSLSNPILYKSRNNATNKSPVYHSGDDELTIYSVSDPFPNSQQQSGCRDIENDGIFPDILNDANDDDKAVRVSDSKEIKQAVLSFNVLAKHGFYSTQNINNIYQLKQYLQ